MKKIEKSIDLGNKKLTLTTGHVAAQATGAVMASMGETVVLATVMAAPMKQDFGYFPLFVVYRERLFAGGKIKGSRWVKRAGRPTDDEILTGRLIDRTIRPLFAKEYNKKEVQVILTVLSVDLENSPDMVAAVAASAAISASEIPWKGPTATIRVGMNDKGFIVNPLKEEIEASSLDLVVSMSSDAVVMIEAGANQVKEEDILKGIEFAQKESVKIINFINEFSDAVGKKKEVLEKTKVNSDLERQVKKLVGKQVVDLIGKMATKEAGYSDLDELKRSIVESIDEIDRAETSKIFEALFRSETRKMIVGGKRPDGRKKPDELRALSVSVGILPRTHGSGLFQRGQTQALTVTTLGAPSLELTIESAEGEENKRYIHHYSMPPYSVGETGRYAHPSNREIGHGALAEKALLPVIPDVSDFPYTIHVVTEILSSNGSTSMASVSGSSLSLMDAGVPIKAPVAGIAMGLITEGKKTIILTDIIGIEDGNGDMDFKVAGTSEGVNALQLDVKTLDLTLSVFKKALVQAKEARLKILEVMNKAISEPRAEVSKHAPKIQTIKIDPEKIGSVIGGGGKTIKKIMADSGAQIDVEDDGSVFISAVSSEGAKLAIETIEGLTKDVEPGEIYDGEVKRIQPFGAFVEVLPGKDGLVHVSDMSEDFVKDPNDKVKIGDKIKVRVKEIDNMGRINLSMILDPSKDKKRDGGGNRGGSRGGSRSNNRRRYDDKRGGSSQGRPGRSSGPHFPTSRLIENSPDGKDR